jgi:hypothetical protein
LILAFPRGELFFIHIFFLSSFGFAELRFATVLLLAQKNRANKYFIFLPENLNICELGEAKRSKEKGPETEQIRVQDFNIIRVYCELGEAKCHFSFNPAIWLLR